METNKILGAIILALLLAAVFSKVADMAIHPEFPDELASVSYTHLRAHETR